MTDVPVAPPVGPADPGDRQILVLHGGGYRGLYTARVLELIEKKLERSVTETFDMIAGTSIGGIIAIGLASGKSGKNIREVIEDNGPGLFPSHNFIGKTWQTIKRVKKAPHDQEVLKNMICAALNNPNSDLTALKTEVIVPALDATGHTSGPKPIIYSNHKDSTTRQTKLIDVALATSAAPTYLPSYTPEGSRSQLIDGGVIANSPSWIALTMATAQYGWSVDKLRMLIIGTTRAAYGRVPVNKERKRREGLAYWLTKGNFFDLIMEGQRSLADSMCLEAMGSDRCFIINSTSSKDQHRTVESLNHASKKATDTLHHLAAEAAETAFRKPKLRQLLKRKRHL